MSEGLYTIKAAADRAETTAELLRAWERRYGVPSPKRGTSGYRLYSEEDVRAVRWIREQIDAGIGARQAVEMFKRNRLAVEDTADLRIARSTLLDLLLAGKRREAEALVERVFLACGVEVACVEVVGHVLERAGQMWHQGEISVAHEHRATEILKSVLVRLIAEEGSKNRGGIQVVVACAPEERHEIGALMLALLLFRRGFDAEYLGQTVPLDDLGGFMRESSARAVFLSVSQGEQAERMLDELPKVEAANGARVFVGGLAFANEELRRVAGKRFLSSDPREAADVAAELLRPDD